MTSKTLAPTLLLTLILTVGILTNPNPAEAGFFSFIKDIFTRDNQQAAVDLSQNPTLQKQSFNKEQKQQQEETQDEIKHLKQELTLVQAQIFDNEQNNTDTVVIERVTTTTSTEELRKLEESLLTRIAQTEALARELAQANFRAISLTNNIDQLSGITINNASITGTLSGLSDSHIPDGITASNYLSLSSWFATTSAAHLTTLLGLTNASTTQLTVTGPAYFNASTTFNSIEYLFPSSDGTSGQFLSTNAAGGLSWSTAGGAFSSSGGYTTLSTGTDNVGIGTSSPYAKLSVVGEVVGAYFTATTTATSTFAGGVRATALNITSTTATSTFANGISLSGGCYLQTDGTCLGSGGSQTPWTSAIDAGGYALTNAGAITGTVVNATSTTATSTFSGGINAGGGNIVIFPNGNVGIGTTSPVEKLEIDGAIKIRDTSSTCDSIHEGSFRYNTSSQKFQGCDGSSWSDLGLTPFIKVTKDSNVNFTLSAWVKATWDTAATTTTSDFTFDDANDRITVNTTGVYMISPRINVTGAVGNARFGIGIYKNGVLVDSNMKSGDAWTGQSAITYETSATAGDYFEIYIRARDGTTSTVGPSDFFIYRIIT